MNLFSFPFENVIMQFSSYNNNNNNSYNYNNSYSWFYLKDTGLQGSQAFSVTIFMPGSEILTQLLSGLSLIIAVITCHFTLSGPKTISQKITELTLKIKSKLLTC